MFYATDGAILMFNDVQNKVSQSLDVFKVIITHPKVITFLDAFMLFC
jgi:hypothetical protein